MDGLLLVSVFILGVMVGGIGVGLIIAAVAQKVMNGIERDTWRKEDEK